MSLRFVVLRHEGIAEPHFDLMFETAPGSLLGTWRSDGWPVSNSKLIPLADHRAEYLNYEGPVSGNRGTVRRIASGQHEPVDISTTEFTTRLDDGTILRLPRTQAM